MEHPERIRNNGKNRSVSRAVDFPPCEFSESRVLSRTALAPLIRCSRFSEEGRAGVLAGRGGQGRLQWGLGHLGSVS